MTEDLTPPSEPRRGVQRRRPRPTMGLNARPRSAGGPTPGGTTPSDAAPSARAPHDPDVEAGAAEEGEHVVRPWEVEAAPNAEDKPKRRRRTVAELLADVPEDSVIVARRLTKKYGEFTAVDSLDLTVRKGEVFGLLGPNGAGKTTTVLMLLGLTEPTRGVVRVVGLDPTREPLTVKRHVGYLPDNVGFYGNMSGRENLRYTARLNGIPRREADARIDELIHEVRLEDAANKKAETYSRGMRQRLGIADALVKSPSVLILDE
ncbi:MAG TPA: ABC transporter ATP-binding protein, partial [Candidatus Limnocylindrales bacterium]